MATQNPQQALDASQVAFFKGIDTAADANGVLKVTVAGGLPAGFYRVCTMSSASNHQPVLMPVAKRGAQDDCSKFTVGTVSPGSKSAVDTPSAQALATNSASSTTATAQRSTRQQNRGGLLSEALKLFTNNQ